VEDELFEVVMFTMLLLLTGTALGLLWSGTGQKPSLERSQELYWRSIVVFILGLVLTGLWYMFGIGTSTTVDYTAQMGISIGVSLVALLTGLNHWRKFREFSRVHSEIEQGLLESTQE
jgi:di/tricarboxylate transporter